MTVREAGPVRILGGVEGDEPSGRQLGVAVHLDVVHPDRAGAEPASSAPLSRGTAFRTSPLLAILDTGDGRLIVVGRCQVTVDGRRTPTVRLLVKGLWQTSHGTGARPDRRHRLWRRMGQVGPTEHNWRMASEFDGLRELLISWLRGNPHSIPTNGEARATMIAKAIAESSRNEASTVRVLRYEIERAVGAGMRRSPVQALGGVLAGLVEFTVAVSRARDEATEAWRDGLSSWRSDPAVYHAQRRLLDPTLPRRAGALRARRKPWFPIHDAGVRQCKAMHQLLTEEAKLMHRLLDSTASVSVARDAQAQETFTLVAAVGGVLIGMPALIIALYDATSVLPISMSNVLVLLPVAAAGLVAGLLAAFLPGRQRVGKISRFSITLTATAAMILLLVLAGSLVNPKL